MRPAAGQSNPKTKASGSVKEPKGLISNESCESMEITVSNEGQRKRQLADEEKFVHPPRNNSAEANLAKAKASPMKLKNQYQTLCGETPGVSQG